MEISLENLYVDIMGLKGLSILQHLNDTQSCVFVEECLLRLLQC